VLSVLFLIGIGSLAEITGDWTIDAVVYHLLGPKVWIREGTIRPVLDNCHTAMPQTGETLYATAMMFGGSRAPGPLNVVVFCMLLLVAASIAKRAGLNSSETWWAVALIITMPAVVTGSTHVFVDGMYAAFVLAAARIAFDAETIGDFALVGLFSGLALGTKYNRHACRPDHTALRLRKKRYLRESSNGHRSRSQLQDWPSRALSRHHITCGTGYSSAHRCIRHPPCFGGFLMPNICLQKPS
jgi:hypothetical protein